MVLLDMSVMDETLLKYASYISDTSTATKVYFVNIIKNIHLPEEVLKEFPDLEKKALEERKDVIKNRVKKFFTPEHHIETEYLIEFGTHLRTILILAEKESIDLIMIGQKKTVPGSGVLAQRLARRASCNILVIPEGTVPKIERVLVPVDFSFYCKLALEYAIFISERRDKSVEIISQNVFSVPVGYHYTGKSYGQFTEVMKKHAQKDYKNFIKDIDTKGIDIKTIYSLDTNEDLASDIQNVARKEKVDGILIGAKGRTATAALFLGSISERLINSQMDVPLMVVRPKGKNVGLLESLREI